jgi:hypothetical protein
MLSTAALASPASTAPASTEGTATAVSGTETEPSSARASVGRVAAAALTKVAATTHVARRAVQIDAMQQHLCNLAVIYIRQFQKFLLDTTPETMYVHFDKERWIWWGIGGTNGRGSDSARRLRFSPPTTTEATARREHA